MTTHTSLQAQPTDSASFPGKTAPFSDFEGSTSEEGPQQLGFTNPLRKSRFRPFTDINKLQWLE
jgi:hypothetical protein